MSLQNPENDNQLEEILTDLPEEEKIEIVKKIGSLSYQKILLRALDILSDDKKTELENLMGQESFTQENLLDFLQKEIPDLPKIIDEETRNTAADLASLLKK